MGGSESTGDLYIELAEAETSPGQEVRGVIHFLLRQSIQADFLVLVFKGKEFIEWKEVRSTGREVHVEVFQGRHVVCVRRFPVFMFEGGKVPAGCYSFPIVFTVPMHIPGSFSKEGKMMKGFIWYGLKAVLEGQQPIPVKPYKAPIRIVQNLMDFLPSQDEVAAQVKTCCCAHNGEIRMRANFTQSTYRHGDLATVAVDVDNSRSTLNIHKITVNLMRTLRMRADTGYFHTGRSCLSSSFANTSIRSGQGYGQTVQIAVSITGNKDELETAPSVRGTIMECIHSLEIRAVTSGCCMCCGQKPKVDRAVVILPSVLPPVQLPVIPRDWTPLGHLTEDSQTSLLVKGSKND